MKIYKKIFEDEVEEGLDFDSVLKTSTDPVLKKAIKVRTNQTYMASSKDKELQSEFDSRVQSLMKIANKFQVTAKSLSSNNLQFKANGPSNIYNVLFPKSFEMLYIQFISEIYGLYDFALKNVYGREFKTLMKDYSEVLREIPEKKEIKEGLKDIIIEFETWNLYGFFDHSFPGDLDRFSVRRIHFPEGLPVWLQGYGLAYKIYFQAVSTFGAIASNDEASKEITKTWAKLLTSPDLYAYVWKNIKSVISKKVKDADLLRTIIVLTWRADSQALLFPDLFKKKRDIWYVKDISMIGLEKILRDRELFTRVKKIIESPKYRDLIVAKR